MNDETKTYINNDSSKVLVSKNSLAKISDSCICLQCVQDNTSTLMKGAFDKIVDVVNKSNMSNYHKQKIGTIRYSYLWKNKNAT